jgi:large subunit ribosomal protein L25
MAQREEITVRATAREDTGKNASRRLRRQGLVPLTIYGGEGETISVAAPLKDLAAVLRAETGQNTVFTLDAEGIGASEVLFQDRQIDPITNRLIHGDLKRLVRGQKIEITVPLHLTGEAIGVREEGGVLEQIVREIEIRVRPRDIPDAIDIDVSNLGVHDVLHVSDIPANEAMEILTSPDTVIATVGIITEEEIAESLTTPTEDEQTEPEVIGKGKDEEEEQ